MKALANLSIRNKLIGIILTATLLSAGTGFLLVIRKSLQSFEEELIETTKVIAQVVSDYTAIDLAFDNPEGGGESLAKLAAVPSVTDAYIYGLEKNLFAQYNLTGQAHHPPSEIHEETYWHLGEGYLDFFIPVALEGQTYGTLYLRRTTETYQEQVTEYLLYMSGLMLAVIVGTGVLAYFLQGVISRPILALADMAQRISANADYSVRVHSPGNDEIGQLYDGFNDMLQQIQIRQEELERSNRDLDQFAYVASHDLKAPLRAISTLSGWIEEDLGDRLSSDAAEQMQLLRSRVKRMDGLIDGILQYSRAGRLDSRGEEVKVGQLVREVVELLDPPTGFDIVVAAEMPTLVTKRLRLEQIFSNLINNAIKYHHRPEEGRVEVQATRRGRTYEFSVRDNGPGIAPEHHDRVFMMFQTLQPRDQVESTGLGLSLVKKLVEEEGGTIRIESTLGQGAAFLFTWPATQAPSTSSGPIETVATEEKTS